MESAQRIELPNENISNREEKKLIEKKVDLDLSDFNDDGESIASSVSSNKSSKSFQSRLRKRFANSKSDKAGHKALLIDLENIFENVEKELDFKNKKIEDLELEENRLLDGILEMNNEMFKLKTKLAEKEIELSQKFDQEEISCIKSLLQSQKESIIQSCMEMYDSKEGKEIIIKVAMEKSNRKIESEIGIHKEEIALFNPVSGEITKCRPCDIVERKFSKCLDIKEKYILRFCKQNSE